MEPSGDVLFRYFADCAWHGLSASDRDGGVSNSGIARYISPAIDATEDAVCVHWSEQAEDRIENRLMRCHAW